MDIFASHPELLDDTQTFIGVLLTFVVLCLFSDKTNFLLVLISNITADFSVNLKKRVSKIDEDIKKEGKEKNIKFWMGLAKEKKLQDEINDLNKNIRNELDIRNSILDYLIPETKTNDYLLSLYRKSMPPEAKICDYLSLLYSRKKEQGFIFLYFLILLLFVMTLDACCINEKFGGVFLAMECIVSTSFSLKLWHRWFFFPEENKEDNKKNNCYEHHISPIKFIQVSHVNI